MLIFVKTQKGSILQKGLLIYNNIITTSRIRTKRPSEVWEHVKRRIRLYPHAMASATTKYLYIQKTYGE